MSTILILLFTLCELNTLRCELLDTPRVSANTLNDNDSRPFKSSSSEKEFIRESNMNDDFTDEDPISSINIDYMNNAWIVQFRKNDMNLDARRRSALDKNFMRFGRSDSSRMRFGKRQFENIDDQKMSSSEQTGGRYSRSDHEVTRDSRGDNFMRFGRDNLMRFGRNDGMMRFGRAGNDMMRFGRAGDGMMRFGRSDSSRMRFGRQTSANPLRNSVSDNPMRFGRSPSENPMRFGRSDNLMRFGRTDNLMRFGRNDKNLMRFGRSGKNNIDNNFERSDRMDNFMRFGRNPNYDNQLNDDDFKVSRKSDSNLMRFGRNDKSFMRFGKLDQNFMRFGKRFNNDNNTINDNFQRTNLNHKSKTDEINDILLNETKLQKNLGTNNFDMIDKYHNLDDSNDEDSGSNDLYLVPEYVLSQ